MKPTPPPPPPPPKPYDAEIEYLESGGTQYVDTGIPDSWSALKVTLDMAELSTSGERDFFGNNASFWNYAGYFASLNSGFVLQLGAPYVRYGYNDNQRHIHVYDKINKVAGLDGVYTNASNLRWDAYNSFRFFLFQRPNANGQIVWPSVNRLYGAKFERNSETIRDFIPVRIGQVGYLFDKVSEELFGNAGTGEFILGPDID